MDAQWMKSLHSRVANVLNGTTGHRLLLIATGCLVFGLNLGATRLWDVDEAIFSEAAVEMLDRGDWVTPYYNGQLFTHKPPFMYWCQIAAFQVFGRTEFAARLFSCVFGIGTLLLTYELGRTLFRDRVGLWGALALAGCINFAVVARAATPDAHLTFFSTLALLILVRGQRRHPESQASSATAWRPDLSSNWSMYAASYAAMAIGTLVKGPVAIVIPMAVWGMFLLIEQTQLTTQNAPTEDFYDETKRSYWNTALRSVGWFLWLFRPTYFLKTVWRMRPMTGLAILLIVAGPWYALVGWRTDGEFLREFFLVQNLSRATNAMEHHYGPPFYYLVTICIGTFPWCVLLWPAIQQCVCTIRERAASRASYVLLACWAAVWVGSFSILATKLASYVIPAFPAIAICFGAVVADWLEKEDQVDWRRWMQRGWLTCASVGVVSLVALPIATRVLLAGEYLPALISLVPLTGAVIGSYFTRSGSRLSAFVTLTVMSVVFCAGLLGLAALPIDAHKNTHLLADTIRRHSGDRPHIVTYKYSPPSLVFYSGWFFERLRTRDQVGKYFRNATRDTFLVTTERQFKELKLFLPPEYQVLGSGRVFLKQEQVVVVGRRASLSESRDSNEDVTSVSPPLAN